MNKLHQNQNLTLYPNEPMKDLTRPPFSKNKNKSTSSVLLETEKRSKFERWLNKHNHKMEFMRTLFGLLTIGLQVVILLKIFNFI